MDYWVTSELVTKKVGQPVIKAKVATFMGLLSSDSHGIPMGSAESPLTSKEAFTQ